MGSVSAVFNMALSKELHYRKQKHCLAKNLPSIGLADVPLASLNNSLRTRLHHLELGRFWNYLSRGQKESTFKTGVLET